MLARPLLLGLILLIGCLLWMTTLIGLIAWAILHPPRMTDARAIVRLKRLSPADLGLEFEDVQFDVLDTPTETKLSVAGWWIPTTPPSRCTAVLLHGYADAKVGGIAWAPPLLACRLNVLAIDSRAHGDSSGPSCTAGFFERHDVTQVIDQLRAARPTETTRLVLFGASMGAATAAAVGVDRDDLAAVVLDSPYGDFRDALNVRAVQRGLPAGRLLATAAWLAERASGARFDAVRPVDLLRHIRCPVLTVLPEQDILLDAAQRAALTQSALTGPSPDASREVYAPPEVSHLGALAVNPDEYTDRLTRFLTAALAVAETADA